MACEYCDNSKHLFTGTVDEDPIVYVEDSELLLDFDQVIESVNINYCPMCGEDLRGDA